MAKRKKRKKKVIDEDELLLQGPEINDYENWGYKERIFLIPCEKYERRKRKPKYSLIVVDLLDGSQIVWFDFENENDRTEMIKVISDILKRNSDFETKKKEIENIASQIQNKKALKEFLKYVSK